MAFPKTMATPFARRAIALRNSQRRNNESNEWLQSLQELVWAIDAATSAKGANSDEIIFAAFSDGSTIRLWFERDALCVSLNGKERKGNRK